MASRNERDSRTAKRRGSGGRLFGLGLLAGIVALALAWLRGCIPGLGVGGSTTPSSQTPAKTEAAPADPAAPAIRIVVDGDRCRRGTGSPVPCAELCTALGGEAKDQRVEVDGTLGTHASVDALKKCLDSQGFRDVVVRAE